MSPLSQVEVSLLLAGDTVPEGLITLSVKELSRLQVIQDLENRQLTQAQAAGQLGLSVRQIKRLLRRYRECGRQGLLSKRRGRPSNNRLPDAVREQAIALLRDHYADFGPTFAHEKLTECHQLQLSVESVRQLLIQAGLWQPKSRRAGRVHQRRERRPCYGELIQVDGSDHDWFEGRAPRCTLLVFIDDATGKLMYLRFVTAETTEAYMEALRAYLERHGLPAALYSDKHSVFRINQEDPTTGTGQTQFGRVLDSLGIEAIHAHSPQAKGRVERANATLQDRLVKEMRLRGIDDWQSGNAFLETFMADFNRRFAVVPRNPTNAHREVCHGADQLKLIFTRHSQRTLSKNLELQYGNRLYQVCAPGEGYGLRYAKVTVCETFDGTVTLLRGDKPLAYTVYDKDQKAASCADGKTLNQRVDQALAKQAPRKPWKPPANHPWRKGPPLTPPKASTQGGG
jgi:transposase